MSTDQAKDGRPIVLWECDPEAEGLHHKTRDEAIAAYLDDLYCAPDAWPETITVYTQVRRRHVYDRDGWACRCCGTALVPWSEIARWARTFAHSLIGSDDSVRAMIRDLEWPFNNTPYEVDHIRPLVEGGSNHPDNLRTLCVLCHRRETAALAARRAAAARDERESASPQTRLGL